MRRRLAAAALACALAVVGGAEAQAASTRAEYAAQVNAICGASAAQTAPIAGAFARKQKAAARRAKRKGTQPKLNMKVFIRFLARVQAIADAELVQLQAVTAAPGDDALVQSWLSNRADLNKTTKAFLALFPQLAKLPQNEEKMTKKQEKRAAKLGLQLFVLALASAAFAEDDYKLGSQLGATACVTEPKDDIVFGGGKAATSPAAAIRLARP